MSWIQILLKFLPLLLQILGVIGGTTAAKSWTDPQIDSLASASGVSWIGLPAIGAILSLFGANWASAQQKEWGLTPNNPMRFSGGASGLFQIVDLFFSGFQILMKDAAWSEKFRAATGMDVPKTIEETGDVVKRLESIVRPVVIQAPPKGQ